MKASLYLKNLQAATNWRAQYNPLRGLSMPQLVAMLEAAERGDYLAAATSPLDGTVITGGPASAPVTAKIIQCVWQDLLLRNGCFNGQAAIFPFPHHAPFI